MKNIADHRVVEVFFGQNAFEPHIWIQLTTNHNFSMASYIVDTAHKYVVTCGANIAANCNLYGET
jgi:hypothetical protein